MDWLRSEDLKEEKVLTTSKLTITRRRSIYLFRIDLVTVSVRLRLTLHAGFQAQSLKMPRICLERANPGLGSSQASLARQTLSEPNTQIGPFAFGILCKIAHSMSPAFGRDLC